MEAGWYCSAIQGLLRILRRRVAKSVGIQEDQRIAARGQPLVDREHRLVGQRLGMDHDKQVVVVPRNLVDVGRDRGHVVQLFQHLDHNPLLRRCPALGGQHLGHHRILGAAEDLQARKHADPLPRRPQQTVDLLRDLVLDVLLLLRPQELDRLLAAGLGLERQTEVEEIAVLVDQLAVQTVLGGTVRVVAVGKRVDRLDPNLPAAARSYSPSRLRR